MKSLFLTLATTVFITAADAQQMLHPYVTFTEPPLAAQLGIASYKFYATDDTNPPAAGAIYFAAVPVGTNACLIPATIPIGKYIWATSEWTNSAGEFLETPFTNSSMCRFSFPPNGPTFMGVILK